MNNLFQVLKDSKIRMAMVFVLIIACPVLLSNCAMNPEDLSAEGNTAGMDPTAPSASPEIPNEPPASGDGSIVISVNTSRVSGLAPLSVFFDATGTTGLTSTNFFADNADYMDATFSWNFDADNNDPDGKYERASGFVAAHVFEDPGTYRVQLNVYDASGNAGSINIAIAVSAFSGTTYYVAANGSDSNTGLTMNDPFLTPHRSLTGSHVQPNTRILFRNGDTFTISNQVTISDKTGPIIIGGYSDPSSPSLVKPIIHTTAVNSDWATIHFYNCSDIRIMNIAARATGESSESPYPRYPYGIGWAYNC
ncbi:MAG: PKD domain-containing protein, partial [Spirochaetota bacterium]